jgi:hypothetical protein
LLCGVIAVNVQFADIALNNRRHIESNLKGLPLVSEKVCALGEGALSQFERTFIPAIKEIAAGGNLPRPAGICGAGCGSGKASLESDARIARPEQKPGGCGARWEIRRPDGKPARKPPASANWRRATAEGRNLQRKSAAWNRRFPAGAEVANLRRETANRNAGREAAEAKRFQPRLKKFWNRTRKSSSAGGNL